MAAPGVRDRRLGRCRYPAQVEEGWRVSGQKVWTSMAREAQWGILPARTDADVPEHRGLSYFLLDDDRVSLSRDSSLGNGGETLVEIHEHAGRARGEQLTVLRGIICDAQSGAVFGLRSTIRSRTGQQPGAGSSIGELIGVEHIQQVWETAVDRTGSEALRGGVVHGDPMWWFLDSRCLSIAGGTTDVQLNIIGERLLGLSSDHEPVPGRA